MRVLTVLRSPAHFNPPCGQRNAALAHLPESALLFAAAPAKGLSCGRLILLHGYEWRGAESRLEPLVKLV